MTGPGVEALTSYSRRTPDRPDHKTIKVVNNNDEQDNDDDDNNNNNDGDNNKYNNNDNRLESCRQLTNRTERCSRVCFRRAFVLVPFNR